MKNLMIDLETMGNSSNAAIVAIGACFFEPSTGEIGAKFSRIISLESSQQFGRIDASTVLWWMKQSGEAREVLNSPEGVHIKQALDDFRQFTNDGLSQPLVWGNGSSFDCVILKNTIIQCLGEQYVPWQFWNERDVRTMVDLGKKNYLVLTLSVTCLLKVFAMMPYLMQFTRLSMFQPFTSA